MYEGMVVSLKTQYQVVKASSQPSRSWAGLEIHKTQQAQKLGQIQYQKEDVKNFIGGLGKTLCLKLWNIQVDCGLS